MIAWPRLPNWTPAVADQAAVAVTNLLMSVAVSRSGGIAALGIFAVLNVTVLACLGFTRTLLLDPWLATRDQSGAHPFPVELRTLVLVGAATSAGAVGVATATISAEPAWRWVVVGTFIYILQDTGRYAAFKADDASRALRSDATLLLAFMIIVAIALWTSRFELHVVLAAWVVGLTLALVPSRRAVFGVVRLRGALAWWHRHCRRLALPLLGDSFAFVVCTNITTYVLATLGSHQDVGLVRVMTSLYSPVAIVFTGLNLWLVPMMAKQSIAESKAYRRKAGAALSVVAILVTLTMTALGPWLAGTVFGREAVPSRLGLALGGLSIWFTAVASPYLASIRVYGRYEPIMLVRMSSGVLSVTLLVFVTAFRSADAYMAVMVAQNLAVFVMARSLRNHGGTHVGRHRKS